MTRQRLRIVAISFLVLYLELVCIRWLGSEMKLFAYFKNFVLMASFAGLGLGCARTVTIEPAQRWLPWGVLALALLCVTATTTGLALAFFPDAGVFQWNGSLASPRLQHELERVLPFLPHGLSTTTLTLIVTVALLAATYGMLALVGLCFFALGRSLAAALEGERPLVAYTANVIGSLAGTLVATTVASLQAPPVVWVAIVSVVLLALQRGRRTLSAIALALALVVTGYQYVAHPEQSWSPYYQIQLTPSLAVDVDGARQTKGWSLNVNHSAFQVFQDLSPQAMDLYRRQLDPGNVAFLEGTEERHALPFRLGAALDRTLIIGAGAGNDVAAALRLGAGAIDAVDIDPVILNLGRTWHPERPYQSPRVRVFNDDARAFIERTTGAYDLIVFGTLDSQSAVSAQSSLRLEYFVYTEESFRRVAALLKPHGLLVVAFGTGWRPWVTERMVTTMRNALHSPVRVLALNKESGRAFFVAGPAAADIDWPATVARLDLTDRTAAFAAPTVRPSTDDWPYLYMDPQRFPWVLIVCVTLNVVFAVGLLQWLSDRSGSRTPGSRRFAWQMFLMGAGFLLVETKGVTELALIFGGTWVVNAIVFAGIFVFMLAANLYVLRRPGFDARGPFACLLAVLILKYVFAAELAQWCTSPVGRFAAPAIACGPLLFASVIFARLFSSAERSGAALGWNIIGGLCGGGLEILAIFLGNRALNLVAVAIYGTALALHVATVRQRARG